MGDDQLPAIVFVDYEVLARPDEPRTRRRWVLEFRDPLGFFGALKRLAREPMPPQAAREWRIIGWAMAGLVLAAIAMALVR